MAKGDLKKALAESKDREDDHNVRWEFQRLPKYKVTGNETKVLDHRSRAIRQRKQVVVIDDIKPEQYAYDLGAIGVPMDEVAARIGMGVKEFETKFGSYYNKGKSELCDKLRTAQVMLALGRTSEDAQPHSGMLIWLGRQMLHQKDRQEIEHSSNKENPVYFVPITRDEPPPTYAERCKNKDNGRGPQEQDSSASSES